jgi:hypothetical protein
VLLNKQFVQAFEEEHEFLMMLEEGFDCFGTWRHEMEGLDLVFFYSQGMSATGTMPSIDTCSTRRHSLQAARWNEWWGILPEFGQVLPETYNKLTCSSARRIRLVILKPSQS